jgi:hypothetical protein
MINQQKLWAKKASSALTWGEIATLLSPFTALFLTLFVPSLRLLLSTTKLELE